MANNTNLRDSNLLQDFTVWIDGVGKIGEAPEFQPPDINIAVEEFRGGGMDGTVEIPFGIEKIEFDFKLHTWDPQVFMLLGYGPGSIDVPIQFRGYMLTAAGAEKPVVIDTQCLIKSIKSDRVSAGKKVELTVSLVANWYRHKINSQVVTEIDVFGKVVKIGGTDRMSNARKILGFSY
jgi:P2 family phage contractile tail tube protein